MDKPPSLTNKHLRTMAWAAFVVAVVLAAFDLATDTVIIGFLSKAAADLIAPTVRNIAESKHASVVEVSHNEAVTAAHADIGSI